MLISTIFTRLLFSSPPPQVPHSYTNPHKVHYYLFHVAPKQQWIMHSKWVKEEEEIPWRKKPKKRLFKPITASTAFNHQLRAQTPPPRPSTSAVQCSQPASQPVSRWITISFVQKPRALHDLFFCKAPRLKFKSQATRSRTRTVKQKKK